MSLLDQTKYEFGYKEGDFSSYSTTNTPWYQRAAAAGGVLNLSTLTGTLTTAAAIVNLSALVKAGTFTSSGAIVRLGQLVKAATQATVGAIVKLAKPTKAGTLTTAGATIIGKVFAGALTTAGAIVKAVSFVRSGSVDASQTEYNPSYITGTFDHGEEGDPYYFFGYFDRDGGGYY